MYRIFLLLITIISLISINYGTPLDDYVNRPDPMFSWKLIKTHEALTHTRYVLNLTSQQWMDASFSSQSIWWHYMVVNVPRIHSRPNMALLIVAEGANTDSAPVSENWVSKIAEITGTVAVELRQIPNQPITFAADPERKSRLEDDIIAWTWNTFIESNGSDPNILLYMAMTKAAVRAMDATEQFLSEKKIVVPQKFVVAGGSKRGWTTWLTAAVDNTRIVGAMPVVLDILNLQKNMKHHYRSLGGWSFALYSYYMQNVTRLLDHPYFQVMADIIDPYAYFDRYHSMKLCQFQGADDVFFFPDSEDYFWNELQTATGGSHLNRIPNTGHGAVGVVDGLVSFYLSVCDNVTLPSWVWTRTINATHAQLCANVSTDDGHPAPLSVRVYQARTVNGTKRDFREGKMDPTTKQVVVNPVVWLEMKDNIDISHIGQQIIYTYTAPMPPTGFWDGIFMQATFPGPQGISLNLTTETLTIPNTFPADPCTGEQCYGTLV